MSVSRIFSIGLDAADKDLVDMWVKEGCLPNFAKLQINSITGDIDNHRGLEAGSVWPSFYFGLKPGNMRQYDGARVFDSESYEHKSYFPENDATKAIWTSLSEAGKRCAVIDVPYNYPTDTINGVKIVDRAGHVPAGGGNFLHLRTHPPALAEEITTLFGPDPAGGRSSDYFAMDTPEAVNEFLTIYRKRIENKADLIIHLWDKEPFDFFLSVFTEAHCAGHRCWHLHDENHELYDEALSKRVGNPLKEIYISLDTAIGRIYEHIKNDASFILYLSHGIGPRHSGTRILDRILARLDNQSVSKQSGLVMDTCRKVWRVMPEILRKPFVGIKDNITNDGFQPNRQGRRFFEVYANDRTAGVRINLKGREAQGIVELEDYDKICNDLESELYKLKNPESGELAVKEIIQTKNSYDGKYADNLPDLLVTWNRSHFIRKLESESTGQVDSDGIDMYTRTGDHRITGRFYALGKNWQPKSISKNVKNEDFAVTFANLLQVQLESTDGSVINALVQQLEALEKERVSSSECEIKVEAD